MLDVMPKAPEPLPPDALGMIDIQEERRFRVGEIHQSLFRELVELPSGVNATVQGKDHLLLVHQGLHGETIASIQYNQGVRRGGGTTIFRHRAVSLIFGPDNILRGEGHSYKTVSRDGVSNKVQREEGKFRDTLAPLNADDLARFKQFIPAAKEQLSKRPK
jgi:hypothetical protein